MADKGTMYPLTEEQKRLLADVLTDDPDTEGMSIGFNDKRNAVILVIEDFFPDDYELLKKLSVKISG